MIHKNSQKSKILKIINFYFIIYQYNLGPYDYQYCGFNLIGTVAAINFNTFVYSNIKYFELRHHISVLCTQDLKKKVFTDFLNFKFEFRALQNVVTIIKKYKNENFIFCILDFYI